ncbi:MAG: hypothetical protein ACTSWP_01680 [Candidatus Freyarchaeota archaeon]
MATSGKPAKSELAGNRVRHAKGGEVRVLRFAGGTCLLSKAL